MGAVFELFEVVREVVCVFEDEVGLEGHLLFLEGREELVVLDGPALAVCRIDAGEGGVTLLFHEHDTPGEAETLLVPEEFTGVEQVAPWQQELEGKEEGD